MRSASPAERSEPQARHYSPFQSELVFFPQFLPAKQSHELLRQLMGPGSIDWRQESITMFGKTSAVPRLSAWYGEAKSYTYSGIQMHAKPWSHVTSWIRKRVEHAAGTQFTNVLLNLYRDGADSMGWHSDDEPELGVAPIIASLSLGATRDFYLRHKDYKRNGLGVEKFALTTGSLLIMRGTTQRYWQHQVPKRSTRTANRPRINLTFRRISDPSV